jgi:hypothetical protein
LGGTVDAEVVGAELLVCWSASFGASFRVETTYAAMSAPAITVIAAILLREFMTFDLAKWPRRLAETFARRRAGMLSKCVQAHAMVLADRAIFPR